MIGQQIDNNAKSYIKKFLIGAFVSVFTLSSITVLFILNDEIKIKATAERIAYDTKYVQFFHEQISVLRINAAKKGIAENSIRVRFLKLLNNITYHLALRKIPEDDYERMIYWGWYKFTNDNSYKHITENYTAIADAFIKTCHYNSKSYYVSAIDKYKWLHIFYKALQPDIKSHQDYQKDIDNCFFNNFLSSPDKTPNLEQINRYTLIEYALDAVYMSSQKILEDNSINCNSDKINKFISIYDKSERIIGNYSQTPSIGGKSVEENYMLPRISAIRLYRENVNHHLDQRGCKIIIGRGVVIKTIH